MRPGNKDDFIGLDNDKAVGFALTSDFCAEHEVGIGKLKRKMGIYPYTFEQELSNDKRYYRDRPRFGLMQKIFKLATSPTGWKRIVAKNPVLYCGSIEHKGEELAYLSTSNEKQWDTAPDRLANHLISTVQAYRLDKSKFAGAWDSDGFIIVGKGDMAKHIFEIHNLFRKGEMLSSRAAKMKAFDNGTLSFVHKSVFSKAELDKIEEGHKENIRLILAANNTSAFELLAAARQKWTQEYPSKDGWTNTPFDYMALSPSMTKGKVQFWLNPEHQDYLNFGWYTIKDIHDWIEGKGKIPKSKEHWEELCFLCKFPIKMQLIASHYKYFSRTKPYYFAIKDKPIKLDKHHKLSNADALRIERHWRYIIVDRNSNRYSTNDKEIDIPKDIENEMFGFTRALNMLGVGEYGAVNTPETRNNLTWWDDNIQYEGLLDAYLDRKIITPEEEIRFLKNTVVDRKKK